MKFIFDIVKGMFVGVANIIPGVSGGTLMVTMGIYDNIINSINTLFKKFKASFVTLLPYLLGMGIAIIGLSYAMEPLQMNFPLQTGCAFVGLILGSVPVILKRMKGTKKGLLGLILGIIAFALVVGMEYMGQSDTQDVALSLWMMVKLLFMGIIASSTMIIPGVSGSMVLMILGYYYPVINSIHSLTTALVQRDWTTVLHSAGILIPFGIGVVLGIFLIAKLIEFLFKRWKGLTYCAILGLVVSSPVVIVKKAIETEGFALSVSVVIGSVICLAAGFALAFGLGKLEKTEN